MALTEDMKAKVKQIAEKAFEIIQNKVQGANAAANPQQHVSDACHAAIKEAYTELANYIIEQNLNAEDKQALQQYLFRTLSPKFHPDQNRLKLNDELKQIPQQVVNSYKEIELNNLMSDPIQAAQELYTKYGILLKEMYMEASRYVWPFSWLAYTLYNTLLLAMGLTILIETLVASASINLLRFVEKLLLDIVTFGEYSKVIEQVTDEKIIEIVRQTLNSMGHEVNEDKDVLPLFDTVMAEAGQPQASDQIKQVLKGQIINSIIGFQHIKLVFQAFIRQITNPLPQGALSTVGAIVKRAVQTLLLLPVVLMDVAVQSILLLVNAAYLASLVLMAATFIATMAVVNTPLYIYDAIFGKKKSEEESPRQECASDNRNSFFGSQTQEDPAANDNSYQEESDSACGLDSI